MVKTIGTFKAAVVFEDQVDADFSVTYLNRQTVPWENLGRANVIP